MPRIFDNIDQQFLPALKETLDVADHADFCVDYFNIRGWKQTTKRLFKIDSEFGEASNGSEKYVRNKAKVSRAV